jgi:hypothetical protein
MENGISIEELKKLDYIGDIKRLESQQAGIQDVIDSMKEKVKFVKEQTKTGNFAEDLVNGE